MPESGTTVHASCVLIGRRAVLIRGPSGAGKSRLALALLQAAAAGTLPPSRLVADDRVRLFAAGGRLLAAAPDATAGKLEVRGAGIHQFEHEPLALVGLVVDLAAADGARMPEPAATETELLGVNLSRLPVARDVDPNGPVLAVLALVK